MGRGWLLFALATVAHGGQFDALRSTIRQAVARDEVPSIVVAVAKDGKILWEEGFGWADREKRIAATENTPYLLSSITKSFTATALMRLVKHGKIDLDKPINDYLGEAKITGPGGDVTAATIRLVANHSSGIPIHFEFFYADEPYRQPTMEETIRRYGVVVRPPGERYEYSNLGYGILGEVIARAGGRSYHDFLHQEIFDKLGLDHTSVQRGKSAATPYDSEGQPLPQFVTDSEAAAGIYSSAHDMVRFGMFHLKAHLSGQEPILSDEMIDAMQEPTIMQSKTSGYGIGWSVADNPSGYRVIYHTGAMKGVSTILGLVPPEKLAVVVLSNSENAFQRRVTDEIMNTLVPKNEARLATAEFPPASDSLAILRGTWQGRIHTYRADLPFTLQFFDSGDIHAQIANDLTSVLSLASWRDGRLRGQMLGDLGTPEAARRPYTIILDLKLRGKVLNGSATAVSKPAARTGSALSYFVELEKQ